MDRARVAGLHYNVENPNRAAEAMCEPHVCALHPERMQLPVPDPLRGPIGPDGRPLFARLPEFVAVYLVFAADVLHASGS